MVAFVALGYAEPSRCSYLEDRLVQGRSILLYTIDYSRRRVNCEPNYERFDSLGESDLVVYTLACQCGTIKRTTSCFKLLVVQKAPCCFHVAREKEEGRAGGRQSHLANKTSLRKPKPENKTFVVTVVKHTATLGWTGLMTFSHLVVNLSVPITMPECFVPL